MERTTEMEPVRQSGKPGKTEEKNEVGASERARERASARGRRLELELSQSEADGWCCISGGRGRAESAGWNDVCARPAGALAFFPPTTFGSLIPQRGTQPQLQKDMLLSPPFTLVPASLDFR